MIIAIDFDDTIHDRRNMRPGYQMGRPVQGALEAINGFLDDGHEVFVLTASTNARLHAIDDWLDFFRFPPLKVTNEKLNADVYIDDRGITFDNWEHVKEVVNAWNA